MKCISPQYRGLSLIYRMYTSIWIMFWSKRRGSLVCIEKKSDGRIDVGCVLKKQDEQV